MTKTDEILSAIRYAPVPIGIAAIYEKVRSVEDIKDLSATLSYLHKNGRVDRIEITTPANRKSFAYTMPERKAVEAQAEAPADPAAQGAQAAAPEAGSADAAAPAEPAPARRKPGLKAKAAFDDASVSAAQDALKGAIFDPIHMEAQARHEDTADSIQAEAIIAHLKRKFAAAPAEAREVHIHIAHLEIHMGGRA